MDGLAQSLLTQQDPRCLSQSLQEDGGTICQTSAVRQWEFTNRADPLQESHRQRSSLEPRDTLREEGQTRETGKASSEIKSHML